MRASTFPAKSTPNRRARPKFPRRTPRSSHRLVWCVATSAPPRATNRSSSRHCASERATTFGRISVLNAACVEQPVVHHLERDPRFDERLVPPLDVILDSAIDGPGGLLRVHEADARQGTIVAQVALPARQAAVEVLDRLQPALVVQRSAELREPRPHPVGDQVGHPQPDLRRVLHRVLPAVRLLDADAEEAGHRFGAERRPVLLGVHPDGPRRHQARTRLAVGRQHRRQAANLAPCRGGWWRRRPCSESRRSQG